MEQRIANAENGASRCDLVEAIGRGSGEWDAAINELFCPRARFTKPAAPRRTRYPLAKKGGIT